MKKFLFPILLLLAAVLMDGCSSGKQAYEKGNYDDAVLKAIHRLRKNPNSKKAAETLSESYPLTISWHRDNIARAKSSTEEFKWERVVLEYQQINHLYGELSRCPAGMRLIPNPVNYQAELNDAKEQAASIRYHKGDQLLTRAKETHDRFEAREAYINFSVATDLLGEYKDVRDKLAESKFIATLKVVIEPIPVHSRNLQLSNEFFENKILEFVETMPVNEFVQFYSFTEAQNIGLKNPDQIIQIQFDDFVLGQTYLKEKEIQVSKDSVILAVIKAKNHVTSADAWAVNDKELYLSNSLAAPIIVSPALGIEEVSMNNEKKVTVCHKIPGSLGATSTIAISQAALQHHIDHGDVQGTCNGETDPQQEATIPIVKETPTEDTPEGETNETAEKAEPTTTNVYGTVKATVHVFHKSLTSNGVMDFKIIDAHNQRVLTQEKMPGEFVWYTEWGYFNGDERALDDYFKDLVKLKEAQPPGPQDLFVAFTQPIYGQITYKIKDFYRNY